jgi:cytochrome c553
MLKKRILPALGILFVLIQLVRIDKTNPPVDPQHDFQAVAQPPAAVLQTMREACYDCHSNETQYPWYSNVAPVSWWLKGHVKEARKHLNFSTFGTLPVDKQLHKLEESAEAVRDGWMPMKSYTWMHGAAKLSDEQRALLAQWFASYRPVETRLGEQGDAAE